MRVLHINCNYTGTTLHQKMIEQLDNIGVENTVFVPVYKNAKSRITVNNNVLVSECFNKWDRLVFDYKQKKIQDSIERIIDVHQYSLIHAYTLFTDGNTARVLSEKYHVPFVVAVRNTDVNDFFKHMVHLRSRGVKTLINAKAVFFLSSAYQEQVMNYVPWNYRDMILQKSYVIPNGIDEFWLNNSPDEAGNRENRNRLIYAGRIDKNKNILSSIEAIRRLRKEGLELEFSIIGRVESQSVFREFQKYVFVKYIPEVPKEQLIKYYRSHSAFIMPSHKETFGLVYAEAMSQGLPVIYTKGQGFDGQFPDDSIGVAVDSKSIESIMNGIKKIVMNYPKYSKDCVELAKRFSWRKIVDQYKTVYSKYGI